MARKKDPVPAVGGRDHKTGLVNGKLGGLDPSWLQDLLRKRACNASTVLIAETEDPIRSQQAVELLLGESQEANVPLYRFDPWQGLERYEHDPGGFVSVHPDGSSVRRPFTDVAEVLRYMDGILKAARTVLVLQSLDAPVEGHREPAVSFAFRSWALDPQLLANGSTVLLVTTDTAKVVDSETAGLLAWGRAPLPTGDERAHLVRYQAGCLGLDLQADMSSAVAMTAGLGLHQLESVLLESWHRHKAFDPRDLKRSKSELIRRSQVVEVQDPDPRGFRAVGGYEPAKRYIRDNLVRPLSDHTRAARFGLALPRGLLLFGPPGVGKTIFARALAHEVNLPFIRLRTENLYSKYLGESGRLFAAAMRIVEQMSPAIVFVDEIDRFGKRTGGGEDGASQESNRVFGQLLEWLGSEDRQAIVVGTTNVPEHLDEAFMRAGRLDQIVPILYPDRNARRAIFQIHLGLTGVTPPVPWACERDELEQALDRVSAETLYLTGAEIEVVCKRTRSRAFLSGGPGATPDHLFAALASMNIDASSRKARRDHYLDVAARYTNDKEFLAQIAEDN